MITVFIRLSFVFLYINCIYEIDSDLQVYTSLKLIILYIHRSNHMLYEIIYSLKGKLERIIDSRTKTSKASIQYLLLSSFKAIVDNSVHANITVVHP